VDAKRIELQPELGRIPSRSEVVRIALERFLKVSKKKG
jgi:Arc/MetJ-type ribon-helix-helix transcriptional regulator